MTVCPDRNIKQEYYLTPAGHTMSLHQKRLLFITTRGRHLIKENSVCVGFVQVFPDWMGVYTQK